MKKCEHTVFNASAANGADRTYPLAFTVTSDCETVYTVENACGLQKSFLPFIKELSEIVGAAVTLTEAGENSCKLTFSGMVPDEYDACLSALSNAGFRLHQANTVGECKFAAYIKERACVCLCFYPASSVLRIIYGEPDSLPSLVKEDIAKLVSPTLTQMGINAIDTGGASGMSYVIQLSNGRYILVDGGERSDINEALLLAYLKEHWVDEGKPVIEAWIISHPHGDHLSLVQGFLEKYSGEVDIRSVAYNFADLDHTEMQYENAVPLQNAQNAFQDLMKANFPEAKTFILHTGMRFWIGDAEFEILGTHEDYYPHVFGYGNDLTTVFRMFYGNKNYTFMGDCDLTLSRFMTKEYGAALKCDVMQIPHHGFNGPTVELYKALDPDACFWPNCDINFYHSHKCLGIQEGFEFNAWLRDASIKERVFYTASANNTILLG